MNDVGFDPARPQPAGQPEPVASGLEGDGDARDLAPRLGRLAPPALEQAQQRRRISRELLQRVARNPAKRPKSNRVRSTVRAPVSTIDSAMASPVAGAFRMPQTLCSVATQAPLSPGTGPTKRQTVVPNRTRV